MSSTAAQGSLSGAATGDGTTIDFVDARARVTMVLVPFGAITGGLVAMQASQDNVNWVTVHVFDLGIRANQFHNAVNGAFRYWRASVLAPVAGLGTVSATFMEADR